jgi:hypothetical protein
MLKHLTALFILLALLAACTSSDPSPAAGPAATARPALLPTGSSAAISTPAASPTPAVAAATPLAATAEPAPTATLAPSPPLTPTPDELAAYAAAMRPGFAGDIAANAGLPRYHLRMWIDPPEGVLTGTELIEFTNRTGATLDNVALRLYPNFPRDVLGKGGDVRMDVTGAAVAGRAVEARYAAQRTAVVLPLASPLQPGQSATLALT